MLRYALSRLLWTLPTLIGVTLVTFLFLSFIPAPEVDPRAPQAHDPRALERLRRERFLDLPRFVNLAPRDARTRALAAMALVAEDAEGAAEARDELQRLGGAALPHVLANLDALAPEPRTRVAMALAPIADRMGLPRVDRARSPDRAVAYWARFWDDRGIEFREASVQSAVRRLARYGTASRAAEVRELDTFALDALLETLEPPTDLASVDRARVLLDIAAHVTARDDRIPAGADVATARACVERWRSFWSVYRSDFVTFAGLGRVGAMLTETRYAKWAFGAATRRLGVAADGEPVLDGMLRRAPITLALVFGAITLAYAAAIPLGALSAASRGRQADLAIACAVLGAYAVPTAVVAVAGARLAGAPPSSLLAPALVLALGLVAAPTRQTRSALVWQLSQEHVRAAIARGVSRRRALLVHGLRNAVLPVVTLAASEPPMALGGAFVVERVFELDGLGQATILAVQTRDLSWLMALALLTATLAAMLVVVSDLAYALLDPRLATSALGKGRAR